MKIEQELSSVACSFKIHLLLLRTAKGCEAVRLIFIM